MQRYPVPADLTSAIYEAISQHNAEHAGNRLRQFPPEAFRIIRETIGRETRAHFAKLDAIRTPEAYLEAAE